MRLRGLRSPIRRLVRRVVVEGGLGRAELRGRRPPRLASGAFLRFAAAFTVSFRARLVVRPSSEAASAKSDDGCAFVVLLLPPGGRPRPAEAALPRFLDGTAFEDGFAG